jgi:hypothetical protein
MMRMVTARDSLMSRFMAERQWNQYRLLRQRKQGHNQLMIQSLIELNRACGRAEYRYQTI